LSWLPPIESRQALSWIDRVNFDLRLNVIWAFRALARSNRVRFATAVALLFHVLCTLMLIRLAERRDIPAFAYVIGFIPIAILATVTQGNLFGVDRGATLTALTAPVRGRTFSRLRLSVALLWILAVLVPGWLIGSIVIGRGFVSIVLMQLAYAFVLCAVGGVFSVFAPSSRAYTRTTGQTMPVTTLVPLNVVSLLAMTGAIKLISVLDKSGKGAMLAIVCVIVAFVLSAVAIVFVGPLFEARREQIVNVLKENP
jgi:hypothetical protein